MSKAPEFPAFPNFIPQNLRIDGPMRTTQKTEVYFDWQNRLMVKVLKQPMTPIQAQDKAHLYQKGYN